MDNTIFTVLKLLGSLALLMYGMKVMSEGLQKLTGDHLRNILGAMTTNRFTGLLTGAFITAAVQSSTATTVMTVSFVNAGLLTLAQAISVIMGANIGTTVTAWIMSIFGFQFNMSNIIFPLFAIALPLTFSKKSGRKSFGEFVFGFAFMFLGLTTLRENAMHMDLEGNPYFHHFLQGMGHVLRIVVPVGGKYHNDGRPVVGCRHGYYINIMFERGTGSLSGYCVGHGREYRYNRDFQYSGTYRECPGTQGCFRPFHIQLLRDHLDTLYLPSVHRCRFGYRQLSGSEYSERDLDHLYAFCVPYCF